MASMRSEDAIASLMAEMGAQQGYEVDYSTKIPTLASSNSMAGRQDRVSSQYPRQLPELEGYPDNSHVAGNHSIWNPYVSPTSTLHTQSNHTKSFHFPTNPQVEVIRRRAFEKFKQECSEVLQDVQQKWGIKLPIPAMLEKWHMDAKLAEWQEKNNRNHDEGEEDDETSPMDSLPPLLASTEEVQRLCLTKKHAKISLWDPILPNKNAPSLFKSTLEPEVKSAWSTKQQQSSMSSLPPKFSKKAEQIQKALYRYTIKALEMFHQQLGQAVQVERQQAQGRKRRRKIPKIKFDEETDQHRVSFAGITLKIHAAYFEKLQRLYDRARLDNDNFSDGEESSFEEVLFCVLCRYDMLQGAGLQAGVPGRVMDLLLERLDCQMECFASPLNCRYGTFASAFDVDRAFGSRGSFFELDDEFFTSGGCYQANPPFCEGVIDAMNRRISDLMDKDTSKPLLFVVFVPAWKESVAYKNGLLQNPFLTKHLLLENGKHWYAEGTQHRRKASFRPASFDTSVLFYQNSAAKSMGALPETVLDDLNQAFCEKPGDMDKFFTAIKKNECEANRNQKRKHEQSFKSHDGAYIRQEDNQRRRDVSVNGKRKSKNSSKAKRDKKQLLSDSGDENKSQLSILKSLGLSEGTQASVAEVPKQHR